MDLLTGKVCLGKECILSFMISVHIREPYILACEDFEDLLSRGNKDGVIWASIMTHNQITYGYNLQCTQKWQLPKVTLHGVLFTKSPHFDLQTLFIAVNSPWNEVSSLLSWIYLPHYSMEGSLKAQHVWKKWPTSPANGSLSQAFLKAHLD